LQNYRMSMTRHTVTVNWNLSLTNSAKTQAQGKSNVIIFLITTQFVHREIQMSHGDTKKMSTTIIRCLDSYCKYHDYY